MKTHVMFIDQAEPLIGVPVRIAGDSDVYVTNDEGKIEIDVITGTHTFEIELEGKWVTRTFTRKGDSPLFILDIGKTRDNALSTMNTLQMDLANLVGDRYVFETVLGRGGMGIVVKAVDRLLNRPVAIKMLSDELQDNEEAQQIFLVEARNLATLSHPNLVAIHDILSIDGRVLMVFEYVLGENLEKMVEKRGGLAQQEALRTFIQLTRVVSYLHDHELIHRDLKPSNVIVQGDGTVKLVDFGLARSLNELYIRGTRVRGTPAYMAPEQVMGIHLTTATDIYQLGISMYEVLAGELPFPSGDMSYAHVHKDPPLLSEKRKDLDPELVKIVNQCLKKQPRDRPATARDLLDRLSNIYARLTNSEDLSLSTLSEPSAAFIEAATKRTTGPLPVVKAAESTPEAHFEAVESSDGVEVLLPDSRSTPAFVPWIVAAVVALLLIVVGMVVIQSNKPENVAAAPAQPVIVREEIPVDPPQPKAVVDEPVAVETPPTPAEPVENTQPDEPRPDKAPVAAKPAPIKVGAVQSNTAEKVPTKTGAQQTVDAAVAKKPVEPVKTTEVPAMLPEKKGVLLDVNSNGAKDTFLPVN